MVSVVRITNEAGSHDAVQVKLKESEHLVQPGETSGAYSVEDSDTLQVKVDKPKKEEPAPAPPVVATPVVEEAPTTTTSSRRR